MPSASAFLYTATSIGSDTNSAIAQISDRRTTGDSGNCGHQCGNIALTNAPIPNTAHTSTRFTAMCHNNRRSIFASITSPCADAVPPTHSW